MPAVLRRGIGWLNACPLRTIERLLFACVVVFVWGLDTHGNYAGSGDDPHYQMIAHSLVFDGDLDLSNDYSDRTNLVGAGTLAPEAHAIPGRGGQLRPVHDVGLPVLFAPYFAIAYRIAEHSPEWIPPRLMARARLTPPLVLRHLLSLAMTALTGLLAVLLFRVCRSAFQSHAPALFWILLFVLSPPLLSHAYVFFTELPTALLVAACWLTLNTPFHQSRLRTALLGAGVGFLLLLHIRNVGLVFGLIILCLARIWRLERRTAHAGWFLAPIVVFGLIRTIVNVVFWGSLVTGPHAGLALPSGVVATITEVTTRVFGLLVDQEHGLLPYAPIYLLVLPGFFFLRKTDKKSFAEACLIILAYLVPVLVPSLNRHGWDGGWSPAARFLVPIAPILVVVGLRYLSRLPRIPITLAILCLVQVTLDLVYWSHPKLLWNLGNGKSALAAYLSTPRVSIAEWLPCWHAPSLYTVVLSLSAVAIWTLVSARSVGKVEYRGIAPMPHGVLKP
jgi:hypothetical protein